MLIDHFEYVVRLLYLRWEMMFEIPIEDSAA